MADHTITVNVTKGTTTPLLITDDEGHSSNNSANDKIFTTKVSPGDIVTWKIGSPSTITSIRIGVNTVAGPGPSNASKKYG